ncbi:MAG: class I SAM-dependent methyltransferase [Bacteroidetes bacterium]|nr:class I SAM-dependent methyltransferase [Bacteroidota bacterium]MCC6654887.1 class I SAM-dependent methyltransferase [Flavobacteriales bacterium]HMU14590.1 class I SAM-dependent methyltransferase [Flavobacteriales bacterium]
MRIHDLYRPIFKIWREKRIKQFRDIIKPRPEDHILDVGGYPHTWTSAPQDVALIECLNLQVYPWEEEKDHPGHRIRIVEGNGCDLKYADNSYPIVFSNSVIEHVGDFEAQQAFAREVRRVGRKLWIQTPAYGCPIEPHYLTPFVHWYPKWFRRCTARYFTVWGLLEKPTKAEIDDMVDHTRLLTKAEMRTLFPDCEIRTERLLGFIPKSYIAIRR